jgi:hypothetical protein
MTRVVERNVEVGWCCFERFHVEAARGLRAKREGRLARYRESLVFGEEGGDGPSDLWGRNQ